MNENGKNKREWVKTAAIIFLSVMLVLTFFSQTIMNYSLPEVATINVQSGTITAKIRGTGVVESGDPYEVKVTESRKVSGVAVREGDKVQEGDVLLYLEDAESDELKKAREDLAAAENAYEVALLTGEVTSANIHSANENVSADVFSKQITNAQAAIRSAEKKLESAEAALRTAQEAVVPLEQKVAQLNQSVSDHKAQSAYESSKDVAARDQRNIAEKQAAYDKALAAYNSSVSSGDAAASATAKASLDTAANELAAAKQVPVDRANSVISLNAAAADLELQAHVAQKELDAAKATVSEKERAVEQAQADLTAKEEDLNELVGSIGNVVDLEQKLEAIDKAQQLVDELTEKAVGATVNADISGTVSQINVKAGNTTSADQPVMVLQPEGAGHTISFSVTNEQAKRLSVGDKAELVNAWRYDDVEVTLASIKQDKSDPGQKKMLTFNVEGDVMAGQTFNLSVGQKSANFDLIVPNSAIREDSNGKFILTVESKSSPLGNRYVATRVDIEVLASDDTQSAISGGLYGYEYVITTSTKPVEAGKLVRLADN